MVIAHYFQKWVDKKFKEWDERREAKARAEGYAQGFAEGLAEARQEWKDWHARRKEAEARGERFLEPPPNYRA